MHPPGSERSYGEGVRSRPKGRALFAPTWFVPGRTRKAQGSGEPSRKTTPEVIDVNVVLRNHRSGREAAWYLQTRHFLASVCSTRTRPASVHRLVPHLAGECSAPAPRRSSLRRSGQWQPNRSPAVCQQHIGGRNEGHGAVQTMTVVMRNELSNKFSGTIRRTPTVALVQFELAQEWALPPSYRKFVAEHGCSCDLLGGFVRVAAPGR